jgi:hypothetical protein
MCRAAGLWKPGLAFAVWRRLRTKKPARPRQPRPERERLDLVLHIAQLDDRFASGEVRQAEYLAERSVAKQRLHRLTLAQKE